MSQVLHKIYTWLSYIRNSIAFYPALISSSMALLGILAIYLENSFIDQSIADNLPVLIIDDPDTARSILNTLIGGIISLMVFSFSMVMVLLSQASSNYSPRLLPGLITNKRHQFVLGFYLGTILFCILCSINIIPEEDSYAIPALTTLSSIVLGVSCLGLFIYFIHSISESIQINNIVKDLYRNGIEEMEELLALPRAQLKNSQPPVHALYSEESGYLVNVAYSSLVSLAQKEQLQIDLLKPNGLFVLYKEKIFRVSRPVDEALSDQIINCVQLSVNEKMFRSHFTIIKNLNEIAVKAMSPGINDPGTALLAVNYLFLLLAKRMMIADQVFYSNKDNEALVRHYLVPFERLMYMHFAELRTYAAQDQLIVNRLLEGLDYLMQQPAASDDYYQVIQNEKTTLLAHAKSLITFKHDRLHILKGA